MASHARQVAATDVNFARATIITLAIDGLIMRESLGVSSFTREQREALVSELMKLADESYGRGQAFSRIRAD